MVTLKECSDENTRARSTSVTHPCGAVEFGQQEEDVLLTWFEGFVLTVAVAMVGSHREAGRQLLETGGDVRAPLVQLSQLSA